MGYLRNVQTGARCALASRTLVGRAAHCSIQLDDARVSNEHAALSWGVGRWVLRDLGSTNGTWSDGELVGPGKDVALIVGDDLAFGDPTMLWQLEDDRAPEPMVTPAAGGEAVVLHEGVIAVPDPESAIFWILRGADGRWMLETEDRVTAIRPDSVFEVAGAAWRFSCPSQWQPTARTQKLRLVQESVFRFAVSPDEERVVLIVDAGEERVLLGQINAFYLLLILARHRIEQQASEPAEECGWIHRERLMRMLRCGEQQLNVWIHRIRSRFANAGFLDYASVIERRDGTGQLRIGARISRITTRE